MKLEIEFHFQPAEKQLAATTTELASSTSNPLKLLPVIGVLLAVVLLVTMISVIVIIALRGRRSSSPSGHDNQQHESSIIGPKPSSSSSATHVSFTRNIDEEQLRMLGATTTGSPDLIPQQGKKNLQRNLLIVIGLSQH